MVIAGLVVVAEEPSLVARQTSSHSFGIWQKLMPKEEAAIRMVELAEINGGWNRSIDLSNHVKKLASEVLVEIARSQDITEAKDFLRNKGLDVHSDQNAVIQ
ncbi:hypothetical protein HPP92_026215 [Vanilla planifolia]|uniref:Uncharacterized protein n=1 Tax=Vanilla planifolia TaxID=51239 RepID=A0A835U7Q9_VANPL|nr:hypothetical protein HPP92_026215 [Vanilla planifolia]